MITVALAGVLACLQIAIALIEMFFWMNPKIHSRLLFDASEARQALPIVRNAGLYNGFLAAGLVWGIAATEGRGAILTFFFACAAIAGVFGAFTLKTKSPLPVTLLIQTLPAVLGLAAIWVPIAPR